MRHNRKRNKRARIEGQRQAERLAKAIERRQAVGGLATFGRVRLHVLKRMQKLSRAHGIHDDES